MKKKRLLVFHPTIAPYRVDLFNDLNRAFDARICLEYWNLKNQKFDYGEIYRKFEFTPEYPRGRGWKKFGWYIRNLRKGADLVLVSEYGLGVLVVLLFRWFSRKKYKVVSLCDDSYDMVANKKEFSIVHRWGRKILAPFCDDLILVNPQVERWYQEHYGKGYYFPIIRREEEIRSHYEKLRPLMDKYVARYDLENKYVFLFVGRLVKLKNVDGLIRAFGKAGIRNARLVIVGDGEEKTALRDLANSMGIDAVFAGHLEGDELYAWYHVADCFVLPSYKEPFGAVVNEALIAGCRCLVSELAGSHCLVQNGVNGYTFDPYDEGSLSERLATMANDSMRKFDMMRDSLMLETYENRVNRLTKHLND